MPYQEIAQTILISSEIRIPSGWDADTDSSLIRALAFASTDALAELSLEDVGGYLDLNIRPVLRRIDRNEFNKWNRIFSGFVQYVEIHQRWFIEQPSGRTADRFAGGKIVTDNLTFEFTVDEDVVGAFSLRVQK